MLFVQPCFGCKSTFLSYGMRSSLLRISNRYTCVKDIVVCVYVCVVFGFYYSENHANVCTAHCRYVCESNDIYEQLYESSFHCAWERWAALKILLWWLLSILSSLLLLLSSSSEVHGWEKKKQKWTLQQMTALYLQPPLIIIVYSKLINIDS